MAMVFTYTGDLAGNPRDALRFAIGDTREYTAMLMDGELDYLLQKYNGSVDDASIEACQAIIAKLGPLCDESVGSVHKSLSQRIANYERVLTMLQDRNGYSGFVPFCGGISRSDKEMRALGADHVEPAFTKDMLGTTQASDGPDLSDSLTYGDKL